MDKHTTDEQGDRIRENLADFWDNAEDGFSLFDLEDIFEDRDPIEFL